MRTTTQLTLAGLAALAATAPLGLAAAIPATADGANPEPTTTSTTTSTTGSTTTAHERGNVIECTGTFRGRAVYASLYENNVHGNVVQVVIGDGDDQVGSSRRTTKDFIVEKQVHAGVRVGGKRAVIDGHASRFGKRIAIHDEFDDAGQHVVVDGYHRKLAKDLTLTWRGQSVPLTCDTAFSYDLTVTKEDITG